MFFNGKFNQLIYKLDISKARRLPHLGIHTYTQEPGIVLSSLIYKVPETLLNRKSTRAIPLQSRVLKAFTVSSCIFLTDSQSKAQGSRASICRHHNTFSIIIKLITWNYLSRHGGFWVVISKNRTLNLTGIL